MTPEEIQQVAQMRAAALRGEDPQRMMRSANVLSGVGGALAGLGGQSGAAMSKDLTTRGEGLRGDALRALVGRPREKTPEELEAMDALADYRRGLTENLGKTKAPDPLARKKLELQVKKMEQETGGAGDGAPSFKESDVRSWSAQIPDGVKNIFGEVDRARAIADEVGGIDKLAGVGLIAGQLRPVLVPEKDRKFRQHAAAAANAYRKIFAGSAVSETESAQINRAIAQVESGKTAGEVATGLMVLEAFAQDSMDQGLAGASPGIKERIVNDIRPPKKKKGAPAPRPTAKPGGDPEFPGLSGDELEEARQLRKEGLL